MTAQGTRWQAEAAAVREDRFWLDVGGPFDLVLFCGPSCWHLSRVQVARTDPGTLYLRGEGVPSGT